MNFVGFLVQMVFLELRIFTLMLCFLMIFPLVLQVRILFGARFGSSRSLPKFVSSLGVLVGTSFHTGLISAKKSSGIRAIQKMRGKRKSTPLGSGLFLG